ncbi:hypothetical protein PC116_g33194 [Phytophthora cactorum]|nr:hypothetical protein PC116_g33194 [Phytophthora cactorum]
MEFDLAKRKGMTNVETPIRIRKSNGSEELRELLSQLSSGYRVERNIGGRRRIGIE